MDFPIAEFDRANKAGFIIFVGFILLFLVGALVPFDYEKYAKEFPLRWFIMGIGFFYLIVMLLIAGWSPSGYKLKDTEFVVRRRFFGQKIYPLHLFKRVELVDIGFKALSRKISGSAGLFGYFGTFHNREWGKFEAQATNSKKALIIFGERNLFVSPSEPELLKEILTAKLLHRNR